MYMVYTTVQMFRVSKIFWKDINTLIHQGFIKLIKKVSVKTIGILKQYIFSK